MRAAIFDLDGTLVKTSEMYRYLMVGTVLEELGVKISEKEMDMFWYGTGSMSRDEIIAQVFSLDPGLFWHVYRMHDDPQRRAAATEPYFDTDVLAELQQGGYLTGLVTSVPACIAEVEIPLLNHQFDSVVVAAEPPKPHPNALQLCLKQLQVSPGQAVYVGNSDEDILIARNAGVLDVLIDRFENTVRESPSHTIRTLYELFDLLK